MPKTNLNLADDFAKDYDKSILKNDWNGPKIIFDEVSEFVTSKSKILDLGIGTGESSKKFQKAGYEVTGLDGSPKMLAQCKKKKIGKKLILHNLENSPFPLENNLFDAVISNGVFHLINPVKQIFSEVRRILKVGGFFAFTFENTNNIKGYKEIESGVWVMTTKTGVTTFKLSEQYISELLIQNNFEVINQKQFLAYTNPELQKQFYFTLIVARLK